MLLCSSFQLSFVCSLTFEGCSLPSVKICWFLCWRLSQSGRFGCYLCAWMFSYAVRNCLPSSWKRDFGRGWRLARRKYRPWGRNFGFLHLYKTIDIAASHFSTLLDFYHVKLQPLISNSALPLSRSILFLSTFGPISSWSIPRSYFNRCSCPKIWSTECQILVFYWKNSYSALVYLSSVKMKHCLHHLPILCSFLLFSLNHWIQIIRGFHYILASPSHLQLWSVLASFYWPLWIAVTAFPWLGF